MSEKNLPIKFFEKRAKDELDTEAGGSGTLPKWINEDLVEGKSIFFRKVLSEVSVSLSKKASRNNFIPSVIRLKLESEALAKTYRRDIGMLFNVDNKLNTIGFNGENEVLIKIDNVEDLHKIEKKMANAESEFPSKNSIEGISAISSIEEYKPQITIEPKEGCILKVKLFNYCDNSLNTILIRAFENHCIQNHLDFKSTTYSGELNIYRLSGITVDALNELKDFDGIQLISEMPLYDITFDALEGDFSIPVKLPKEGISYPVVGVLDSGISNIPHLAPWLLEDKTSSYPDEYVDKGHGTFVAGVLIYGDELEGKNYTGFEGCKLFEAIVIPDPGKQKISEDELVLQIWEAVSNHSDIKIWNLSLGSTVEADLFEFSDFGIALDDIQEQFNVLICKSAGNCTNFKINAPISRISRSADTVRGIVVGSITQDNYATNLAEKHHPSPFSRIGPGPSHLIKPDVAHIGGNVGLDASNEIVLNPVKSFSKSGDIAEHVGTSFSTPRITAIASGLDFMLNETFNATLIKALIIHSAKYPAEMKMKLPEKMKAVGFGIPSNIQDILFNDPNEITLILQDTIERGNYIDILDFPYPQSMVDEDGYFYGEITVTLVTSPILEATQGAEYCQSNINVMLGTYDEKVERDMSKPRTKNPIGTDERKNLLSTDNYSKKAGNDLDLPYVTERMLITYGDKFQPVKKWSVNLAEMTDSNREKYLKSPKQWYLKLVGLFRHFTETKCEQENRLPSQEFCLIVTIKDTRNKRNIYNEVTQLLDSYSFIHNNIKIKEEVRIRLNG